jgi:hypothetical protein
MFEQEIGQLRKQVREKSQQLRHKKEEFCSLYKKQRSSTSMLAEQLS